VGTVIYRALPARIVPVALKGTDGILPRGGWIPRIGRRVRIAYGPPMDLTRFYRLPPGFETSQKIVAAVMEQIEKLHQSL
jgi:1-acyl-sn-glycerol-3-phosphate acyltransferase